MTDEPIQLLLVDDHFVVRKGLVHVLATDPSIEIVGEASSGEEALYLNQKLQPDVILMDIKMEGIGGIKTTRMIVEHHMAAKVIGLSTFSTEDIISGMKEAGARGYLLKDVSSNELTDAIHRVNQGEILFPEPVPNSSEPDEKPEPVSPNGNAADLGGQQKRVLALMTKGLTNPEIAEQLGISTPTARYHVSAILRKLDVSNRSEAVAAAIQMNLISASDIG